ncbi:ThiF family adenylyltransferase [Halobaculum sp. MBLA0147]|uniref:SAMP-activating enzyme E1 n=1 Tax=Halobaculum sp. MBLA0147 TaxID=3079934 RepID=UPI003525DB6C
MSDLALDATQLDRYSRHVIMDEVGPAGQAALLDAAVLVVGAGGLGSPVIQYLAAAGVGRLGIADDDVVERSNLQRQVVHADADVGRSKTASAAAFVRDLNPDVTVVEHETRVDTDTVEDLLADYDLVVDASDNFRTRYVLNDAARLRSLPVVHGAIYRFEGQVTTLHPAGPCYRCLFPSAPEPGEVPNCAETGVLGVLPGVVGSLQATEAVKLLVDHGDPLVGRLLFYDAADLTTETVAYEHNPDCPVCGDDPVASLDEFAYDDRCRLVAE